MIRLILVTLAFLLPFSIMAKTTDWMVGTWVPAKEDESSQLKKLVVTQENDIVRIQAWLNCETNKCRSTINPATQVFEKRMQVTYTHYQARFIINDTFVRVTLRDPMMSFKMGRLVDLTIADPKLEQDINTQVRMIEPGSEGSVDEPCTCAFNSKRMWNPETIIWNDERWRCTGYNEETGACLDVEVVKEDESKK